MEYINVKHNEYKKLSCPNCKSESIIKWGKRKTQNRSLVQRYLCKSCDNTFIQDPFFRMRNTPEKITCALDLFYRGLSTREVQEHFKAFFPHNSDHSTILRWIRKYSLKIASFTDNLKVNSGSYVEFDEMEFARRKSHKRKGTDKNWFIDAIDVKTRFMVASKFAKYRNKAEIKQVLQNLKNKTENVKIITTDGLTAYVNVVKQSWGYDNHLGKYKIEHRVRNASAGEGFNIWVERMHNTIRQRTRGFRGLHGSVDSAYALMKGIEIHYNFIKKHEALKGKTPSDMAIPTLQFQTPNRWLELINLANKSI
jgi:putative transposase